MRPADAAKALPGGVRGLALAALCATCLAVTSGAVILARGRTTEAAHPATEAVVSAAGAEALAEWRHNPYVVFMSTAPDDSYGKVAVVPLDHPAGPRYVTSLECTRVYFSASQGLCLDGRGGGMVPTYTVDIFDDQFETRPSFHGTRLAGPPSRARVAPNGQYASMTAFAAGDGYAAPRFSTRTTLLEMASGRILGDLEQFTVWRDGTRIQSVDFNFWGVTFSGTDPSHFFATLGTDGTTYLIEGDVTTQQATVLVENVECPSLSPDGTRLAFKQRIGGSGRQPRWQLAVLDLATLTWSPLEAESRSVDDQVEWLDNQHILYGLSDDPGVFSVTNVWILATDGGSPPRMFIPQAWSPAVVR